MSAGPSHAGVHVGNGYGQQFHQKTRLCIVCDFPVVSYGRLWPCLHAFCLSCSSELEKCFLCHNNITRVEKIEGEKGLFVSPATLQTFKTEADLQKHAQEVRARLIAAINS